ncbi:MAG: family 10 glycosylhydrolase [Nitrospinota bacterium]|nr:family 10 glycosylhydrolase [Nitrospinota bacterium]MDP7370882.1 family 10 glycosylhydrolase [Nitrospinota bacterium]MDP7504752.1 family 10 glycosylhydrolase [Nitrospinota bacterium]MDP7664829.1 family 10 glycosylhydrolase [Nitrospinota bacterium]HJP14981.1 family 10 glycosylhydrolase [Nitrospinota bacterium]
MKYHRLLKGMACLGMAAGLTGCAAVRSALFPACPFSAGSRPAARGETPFEVGLWVQAEGSQRTLDNADKIRALVAQARKSGVTDIYAQVYRSGRAWFPTRYADDSPARRAGGDPLAYLLKLATEAPGGSAIRVHAWINAFSLARNAKALIISDLGDEAVLRDQFGHSLLEYPPSGKPPWAKGFGLGTPGIFLDPAHLGVRRRLVIIASELLRRYPSLAGIHLDFIRYPYALPISPGSRFSPRLDFGYGRDSVARFRQETGRRAPLAGASVSRPDYEAWDTWRRRQVTEAVREVLGTIRAIRPASRLSAALLPWPERAYLSSFQDWRSWLREGLLDKAIVMNYSRDMTLASEINWSAAATRNTSRNPAKQLIIIGLGVWLFEENPPALWRQWRDARLAGVDGVALFSYDQMAGKSGFWRFPRPKTSSLQRIP